MLHPQFTISFAQLIHSGDQTPLLFCSILGNEGHLNENSNVKMITTDYYVLLKKVIIMITESRFAMIKVAFLAVDEQLLLLHLLYPVLQSYSVQHIKICILHPAAIPPQWHC